MAHTASSDRSSPSHRTLAPWDVGIATPWLGDRVPAPEHAPLRDLGAALPVRPGAAVSRVAMPAVALGALAMLGLGCASGGPTEPGSSRQAARELNAQPEAADPNTSEVPPSQSSRSRPTRERVVFSDEPNPTQGAAEPASSGSVSAQELAGAGLVDALASSYEADRRALADMQSRNKGASQADQPATAATAAPGQSATLTPPAGAQPADVPAGANPNAAATPPATTSPAATANISSGAPNAAPSASTPPAAAAATPAVAPVAAAPEKPAAAPVSPAIQANAALELPPAIPTDPKELTRLLAESLVRTSGESDAPLTQWFAFAALAVGNPDLPLPEDFGADLLESERERVRKAHAAFAALGKALQSGKELEKSAQEDLLAALATGPRMSIPKLDLCTRVEAFGRYNAIANRRFLAGSNPRFIVYSEVDGFTSALEEGQFVTRLATRVSIETERDGVEVWQRSPEWTGSIDASEVRRSEFFLCEIVQLSEHLSVGGYRLKIQVRDEATGEIAVHALPFHVVADPAMVSVGD